MADKNQMNLRYDLKKSLWKILKSKEIVLIAISVIVVLVFRLVNPHYLSLGSLNGIMQAMSITGIIAVGISALLIGGSIDLSASQVSLFAGVICALLMQAGVPWGFAVIITLICGACFGMVNAFLITKVGMMAFIATIAVGNVLSGVNMTITRGQQVPVTVQSFWWGGKSLFGALPYPFLIMVILMVVYGLILNYTQFGRNIYLVGGNQAAARLTGVNPVKVRAILYINNSVLASAAGIVLLSRMQTASPQSQRDAQMEAITAAILGGIAFTGGAGGMTGCFIGVLLFSFFNSGLQSLALDTFWSQIASGLLLIVALTVDFFNTRSREKSLRIRMNQDSAVAKEVGR